MDQHRAMKLTIIDKYIAKELMAVCLAVYFVLLIIVLSTETVHLLRWVSQGIIPVSGFLSYLFNSLFEFSVILIPMSLLMGILLAFGRLYSDSEMAAIMSAGIGPMQWYRPLLLVAVPTTLLLLVLLTYVQPLLSYQRALISAEYRNQPQIDKLLVGQFNHAGKGGGVLFMESGKKTDQISSVFFQQQHEKDNHVDLAENTSSHYDEDGRRYMVMHNGTHYIGNAGETNFKIIKYQDYGLHVDIKTVTARMSAKTTSTMELWNSDKLKDRAELQWRFTIPLASIIVAFMALPLSHTNPRSGRYSKLAVSLIIYLLYSNLLGVGKTWIEQGKIPVWIGTWWVHLIAIVITLVLLKRGGYLYGIGFSRSKSNRLKASNNLNGS